MSIQRPNLDSVTTIGKDGSRKFLHPADVKGSFTLWRRLAGWVLILVYVVLPLLHISGHPAVFLDVAQRRFHLFGLTLAAQDMWMLFFLISGVGFMLFVVTSILGRIWCGWACPYTVFLEHVFRRIERLVDGDSAARKRLEAAPWTAGKIARRVIKHALYILCAGIIAHVFLSYFVSVEQLSAWVRKSPLEHPTVFAGTLALSAVLYFCFAWFREQFCIIMCPYGRLQSALTDDDTMVIGYDKLRGEPRGKQTVDAPKGDCVDCMRCVNVCPTGIDIRNGLQLECIGCAACIDACDDIMTKLKRPTGLVRYDSLNGLTRKPRRIIRPRILVYLVFLLLGATAFFLGLQRFHGFEFGITRMKGLAFMTQDNAVKNQFTLRLTSKADEPEIYDLRLAAGTTTELTAIGMDPVEVPPQQEAVRTVVLVHPLPTFKGRFKLKIEAVSRKNGEVVAKEVEFLGPDAGTFTAPPTAAPPAPAAVTPPVTP